MRGPMQLRSLRFGVLFKRVIFARLTANQISLSTACVYHTFLSLLNRALSNYMNTTSLRFVRRLGPNPHFGGAVTSAAQGCPDIFELGDGDFAVIGIDVTNEASPKLPHDASCGPDERIVRVPRKTLVSARCDIPEQA